MTDVSQVAEVMDRLGFTDHDKHPAAHNDRVKALSHNGPYRVLGAWQKDNVLVHVEQNTAPEKFTDEQGNEFASTNAVTYPPVIVIEVLDDKGAPFDPPHTAACSFGDIEAFTRLVNGDRDFNENG